MPVRNVSSRGKGVDTPSICPFIYLIVLLCSNPSNTFKSPVKISWASAKKYIIGLSYLSLQDLSYSAITLKQLQNKKDYINKVKLPGLWYSSIAAWTSLADWYWPSCPQHIEIVSVQTQKCVLKWSICFPVNLCVNNAYSTDL